MFGCHGKEGREDGGLAGRAANNKRVLRLISPNVKESRRLFSENDSFRSMMVISQRGSSLRGGSVQFSHN